MNDTKIEWCDDTWNPVTGCYHNCPYCYARGIVERFGSWVTIEGSIEKVKQGAIIELDTPSKDRNRRIAPYPRGFIPTLHKYKLDEYAKKKKPKNVFVCSMADLFGEWVPDKWIKLVFEACDKAPQHRYLFLTKNPQRYGTGLVYRENYNKSNFYFGETVTNNNDFIRACMVTPKGKQRFLSIEPLHEKLDYTLMMNKWKNFQWVIIGAETGNRKNKIMPKREWIKDISDFCRINGVPIFMKNNLAEIWGEPLIQEYPWEKG